MANTLRTAINEIQDILTTVTGIRKAPDYPPEKISHFPFITIYPVDGTSQMETLEYMLQLWTVAIEVHVARKDLPRDVDAVLDYAHHIPNALYNAEKAGSFSTIETLGEVMPITFGALDWGDQKTIGFRFSISGLKIQNKVDGTSVV